MSTSETPEVVALQERFQRLVAAGDMGRLADALAEVHASDVADLLESLTSEDQQLELLRSLPSGLASEALSEMEGSEIRGELLAALDPGKGAELLHELAADDAADLIGELEPEEATKILDALPVAEAVDLQELLSYDEESAGGLMTTELVSVLSQVSAAGAIAEVRRQGREVEDFYTVFVVDTGQRLLGAVPLADLILADPDTPVAELVEEFPATILPSLDQEEVGHVLARYNLVSVPVCDDEGRLLGRITFDDVIDVMEAEQTEDILRLAGVSDEEEVRGDWTDAVKARLPWLVLNLGTLAVAASVILAFEETISTYWYLAAVMPIIAGLGGNAATQALAVTVRRMAVTSGPLEKRFSAVSKEFAVALLNGFGVALLAAAAAFVIVSVRSDIHSGLPVVVFLAMWGNVLVAGFAGAFIPTVLHRFGADPAVASSVFVTTLTDLVGFFLLLGLADRLLLA